MTEIHLSDKDKALVEDFISSGAFQNASEVVAAGLQVLRRADAELRRKIQQGLDDVEAGRVHHYETAEEFLADIKQMSGEAQRKTGTGH